MALPCPIRPLAVTLPQAVFSNTPRVRRCAHTVLLFGALLLVPIREALANRIPYFARKYNVACSQCHVSVPRLNAFGAEFLARGYQMAPGSNLVPRRTIPLAVWISARSDSRPPGAVSDEHVRAYLNRIEIISGGVIAPRLSYFVEWRPVSQESRGNGTLRDRSGRFEDIFVVASQRNVSLTVGQFRQLDQVDVSRRLGISEPLALSASLPGRGGGSARERSLRSFAPSGRSPSVRLAWLRPVQGWNWTAAAALPIPGELSIPLNDEARIEASNEIEWRPKGVFAESYLRRGPMSLGVHGFYDDADRYLANALATGQLSSFYWTGVGGAARTGGVLAGRWSIEGEYIPHRFAGVGGRVEDRAGDGADAALLPYVNFSFPATRYTIRLTLERRFQRARSATFIELGTVF